MWVLWSNDISPTRSTIVLRKFGVGGVDLLDGELRVASGNDQLPPAAPVVEPLSPEGEGANLEGAGQGLKISRGPGNTIKMPEFPQPIEPQPNSYNINATETVAENVGSQPRNPRISRQQGRLHSQLFDKWRSNQQIEIILELSPLHRQ